VVFFILCWWGGGGLCGVGGCGWWGGGGGGVGGGGWVGGGGVITLSSYSVRGFFKKLTNKTIKLRRCIVIRERAVSIRGHVQRGGKIVGLPDNERVPH